MPRDARRTRSGFGMRALWGAMFVVVALQIFLLWNGSWVFHAPADGVSPVPSPAFSLREDALKLERTVVSTAAYAFDGSLRDEVVALRAAMAKLTCSTMFSARDGLCNARVAISPNSSAASGQHASTADKAVFRAAGYKRDHRVWSEARDHWATQAKTQEVGQFRINTHDPEREDRFISRAVHHHTIWDESVFNVFKYVLVTKGLPPSRVIDVGGNIGYFTLCALAMGHHVTTFEPMDYNLLKIVSSIAANGFSDRHTLYQVRVAVC